MYSLFWSCTSESSGLSHSIDPGQLHRSPSLKSNAWFLPPSGSAFLKSNPGDLGPRSRPRSQSTSSVHMVPGQHMGTAAHGCWFWSTPIHFLTNPYKLLFKIIKFHECIQTLPGKGQALEPLLQQSSSWLGRTEWHQSPDGLAPISFVWGVSSSHSQGLALPAFTEQGGDLSTLFSKIHLGFYLLM